MNKIQTIDTSVLVQREKERENLNEKYDYVEKKYNPEKYVLAIICLLVKTVSLILQYQGAKLQV